MKKIIGCILFSSCILIASGQPLYLSFEAGKSITAFDYKNSQGESLADFAGSLQNNLGAGLRMYLFNTDFHFAGGATYNKYEAKGSDEALGNYYEWEVEYIGLNAGIDYEFFKPEENRRDMQGMSIYTRGIFGFDYLIKGTQILNDHAYDLTGVEEFDKPVYFVRGCIGTNYYISSTYYAYAQYTYGRSVLIGNYANKEKLRFKAHQFNIGFAINLFYAL